eukprot:m.261123 g.261123  ORF g.261123 m.261123 type:complete len:58 (+) comp26780_c1_seq38:406-579(+)
MLLEAGANFSLETTRGRTALDVATEQKKHSGAELLKNALGASAQSQLVKGCPLLVSL